MLHNHKQLSDFITNIADFNRKLFTEKIILFGYYLQKKESCKCFTIDDIKECFSATSSPKPTNFTDLFNKLEETDRIIKEDNCWILSGLEIQRIEQHELGSLPMISIKDELKTLPDKFPEVQQKFVNEILGCLQVQAWRGAIVLTWILIIEHLQKIVLTDYLEKFNEILNGTKLYKNFTVGKIEDFEEIKDNDFLITIKTCGMLSRSQHTILETRLKERNRYAHPTNLEITDTITIAFIEDLIHNILFKVKSREK